MDESTDDTTWVYQESARGGQGHMQHQYAPADPPAPALDPLAAHGAHVDHIMGCTHCMDSADGSMCHEGHELWLAARAARS